MQCQRFTNFVERKVRRIGLALHSQLIQRAKKLSARRQRPVDSRKGVKVRVLEVVFPGHQRISRLLCVPRTKLPLRRNLADRLRVGERSPKPEWFVEIDLIQNQVVDPPIERLLSRPCWSREYVCV